MEMSSKRKITVSASASSGGSRNSRTPDRDYEHRQQQPHQQAPRHRASVFSRLGTKKSPSQSTSSSNGGGKPRNDSNSQMCRNMQESGSCQFGNGCKYAHTHKLKQSTSNDDRKPTKGTMIGGKRPNKSPNIDTDWQNWNEESLDYEDERMLEKRRLLLQRELAKESDTEADGKPSQKPPVVQEPAPVAKKVQQQQPLPSSSSTSSSSTSESGSSSSSSGSSDEAERPPPAKKAKVLSSAKKSSAVRDSSTSSNEEKPRRREKIASSKKRMIKKKGKGSQVRGDGKKKSRTSSDHRRGGKTTAKKKSSSEKRKSSPIRSKVDVKSPEVKPPPPPIRKGLEVDKFGFYHAQPIQQQQQQPAPHEGVRCSDRPRKEGRRRIRGCVSPKSRSRHDSRGSKRSASSEKRPVSPPPAHKRKRRSSTSPQGQRKRRSSPLASKSSKPSYAAARSGSSGRGGDRDLRDQHARQAWSKRSSLSPPRPRKKNNRGGGHKKAQLTGANAVSIDASDSHRRGNRQPLSADRGLRRNRSRSGERLLPPQALQNKSSNVSSAATPTTKSLERSSSRKNSQERSLLPRRSSPPAAEQPPRPASKLEEDPHELSTEDLSDIGESDEELLNQDEPSANADESKSEDEKISDKEASEEPFDEDKVKESDLLEGISEEELDVSDEEEADKVKVADALGVDWSQLITPKHLAEKANEGPGSFRQQWTPAAIIARIGLPKSLLKPGLFEDILERLNAEEKVVDILHPIAALHAYYRQQKETSERPALQRPALSSRVDLQMRRKLLGLPPMSAPFQMDIF